MVADETYCQFALKAVPIFALKVRPSGWVLIRDHHEGYIGWDEFERNQRLISDNANGKSWASRGSVRRGEALLAGLFRCSHWGRKLHVAYGGTKGDVARYHCRTAPGLPIVFPNTRRWEDRFV